MPAHVYITLGQGEHDSNALPRVAGTGGSLSFCEAAVEL